MSNLTPSFSVNVDVTNPGQFFACCGLLELAHRLWPGAEGWFDEHRFLLVLQNAQTFDLQNVLNALISAQVRSLPSDDPKTAPLQIHIRDLIVLRLDWWCTTVDLETTKANAVDKNPFKTWAANATSAQMFTKWQKPLGRVKAEILSNPADMLKVSARQQGSYGFDSDLCWDALNIGFSLNEHRGLKELPTRPATELLGAIGLQRFFPVLKLKKRHTTVDHRPAATTYRRPVLNLLKDEEHTTIEVQFATWRIPLSAPVARVATLGSFREVVMLKLRTRFVYRGSFKGLEKATIIQGEQYG
ncbi:hypothetical protein [Fontivita pretiosa]|uniref:hypothetical protein n=1 Tax=Fontivita pretiosa TaxID=2989684 RepID=UPI003D16BEF6